MPMAQSRLHVLAAFLVLAGGIGFAAESDFDKRWKEAESNVTVDPGKPYFNDLFFKESLAKFGDHMSECAKRTGERRTSKLRAAVELAAAGNVLTVLTQGHSKSEECFAELVKKDAFSKPPTDHFWVPVEMRFSKR